MGSVVVTTLVGLIYINPLLNGLGLTEELMGYGKIYAQLLLISMPFLTLKIGFEYFLRVDHNATLSFIVTLSGGLINIVLDYLFVAVFNWGVTGAGLATLSGIVISSILGLYYFIKYAKQLNFVLPKWHWKVLLLVCKNGLSELFTEASSGVFLFYLTTNQLNMLEHPALQPIQHFCISFMFLNQLVWASQ